MVSSRDAKPAAALAVGLVAFGWIGGGFNAYELGLYVIYGIATQGVAMCWGRLGILSLGNAMFFGMGGYLCGALMKAASANALWYVLAPAVLVLPCVLAYTIGRLLFSRTTRAGPYFSLVTLALSILAGLIAEQWSSVTGGYNGMLGIPALPGFDRYGSFYWVIVVAAVASTWLITTVSSRPLGVVWRGIAQNEHRLQLYGYATDRIKAWAFALSALLAALAGALFTLQQGLVTPQAVGFALSTDLVIWAAVGGKSSALGSLLGAVGVGYASMLLRQHFSEWEVVNGALFVTVVLYLPNGLAGLWPRRTAPREPFGEVAAPSIVKSAKPLQLELHDVHAGLGGVRILNGLKLSLDGPGIRSVIGPNGAGKTSTFNAITGQLKTRQGRILLDGVSIQGLEAWRIARRGIGRKFQIPTVFPELSVADNLRLALWAQRLHGMAWLSRRPQAWRTEVMSGLLERFPVLGRELGSRAGDISQGHRQALEFAMTMLPEPRLVLLDEPCAGLSPTETAHMAQSIRAMVQRIGAAALLIEHDISAVAAMGGEVFVLHQGALLARGDLAQMQADPSVRAVYAGGRK
ncbi:ATP-binding cassette domain-containing protein [Thiomonas sp. FB-6]|uniref:branched-chain amino acid ABC transporter ATP-binding protein/permease n=1 Tax=Thiomonas sp. FB-6 TaxID=1158291 RepID=UPI0003A7EFEC|nr:ATP-binding cassette domain-containing protein [Thiomonas sp. FB-6]